MTLLSDDKSPKVGGANILNQREGRNYNRKRDANNNEIESIGGPSGPNAHLFRSIDQFTKSQEQRSNMF